MSVRLMTLAFEADLSAVAYTIPAHVVPATKTSPEKIVPEETGQLSSGDKFVLVALADNAADDGGSIFPSVETLSEKTQQTGRGCQLALRHLEGAKLLDLEHEEHTLWIPKRGLRRTRTYRINVDFLATFRRPEKKRTPELSSGVEGEPRTCFRVNPELGSGVTLNWGSPDSSVLTISTNHQKKQKQNHALQNSAGKSAQSAVQLGVLLPEVAVTLEAPLEVPTGSAARPAGSAPGSAAAPGAPSPATVATAPRSLAAVPPSLRGQQAVAAYCEAFKARYAKNPIINGKDGNTLKRLAQATGADYQDCLTRYFADDDPFLVKAGHSTGLFENRLNALRVNGNHGTPGRAKFSMDDWVGQKSGDVA